MVLLHAVCWICGEEYPGLRFGNGFMNQEIVVPAWEKGTHNLTSITLGNDEQFKYYTDPSMYRIGEDSEFIEWGDLKLCSDNNYCPDCEELSMDFKVMGQAD